MRTLYSVLLIFILATFCVAQEVRLAWDPNPELDLAGYNIYKSVTSGSGFVKANVDLIQETTYRVTDLTFGVRYYFVATAVNTSGLESGYSNEVTALILNPNPPAAPTGLTVQEAGVNVAASWGAVPDAERYGVFYRAPGASTFSLVEVVSEPRWSGKLPPPPQRRGGELGVASLSTGGWSAMTIHGF